MKENKTEGVKPVVQWTQPLKIIYNNEKRNKIK